MNTTIDLPQESIRLLEVIKATEQHKPISISIDDMVKIPKLIKEIKAKEQESESTFAEIQQIELEIQEKQAKIEELKESIDPRIRYLRENPVTQDIKTVNHAIKDEYTGITPESIMEVLRNNPYGLGNAEIAKKLNQTDSSTKGEQNKVYTICKKLESENKIKSENRTWKAV